MQTMMKQMAETLSRQRGVQYEFGPEYEENCAKNTAGILENSLETSFRNVHRRINEIHTH